MNMNEQRKLLSGLIEQSKIKLGYCIICKKKTCNKDCGFFGNSQFLYLVLEKISLIVENEKSPENINIKKITRRLRKFAVKYHEKEMEEIEQTKLFYHVYRQINERLGGRLGPQPL